MPLTYTVETLTAQWTAKRDRTKQTALCVYQVRVAGGTATPNDVLNAIAVTPYFVFEGGNYPGTTGGAFPCSDVEARAIDQTRTLFRVEASFDTTSDPLPDDPLSVPAKISVSSESTEESYYKDKTPTTPKYAKHYNDVPFSELPKRTKSIKIIDIEKNVDASTTEASLDARNDTTNSATVTINGINYAEGVLKQTAYTLSEVKTANGIDYKTQKVTLKANKDGWKQKFESVGLVEKNGHAIVDTNNNPVTEPWPLTTLGVKQTARSTPGAEIELQPYDEVAYSGLT